MAHKPRIILIHGAYGNPNENWFPHVYENFADSHELIAPTLPTPEGQTLKTWMSIVETQVLPFRDTDIIIGHSIGAALALRMLEKHNTQTGSITATALVSSFMSLLDNDAFDPLNETFVSAECDWQTIKQRTGQVEVWHGDNDPYVPIELGRNIADRLQARFTTVENGGHINEEAGFTKFHPLIEFVKQQTHNATK